MGTLRYGIGFRAISHRFMKSDFVQKVQDICDIRKKQIDSTEKGVLLPLNNNSIVIFLVATRTCKYKNETTSTNI